MFIYRDLSIFPPDSNVIQIQLKQGCTSLYKIMLANLLYCFSLLRCSISFSSFPQHFGPVRAFFWRWSPLAKRGLHLQMNAWTRPKPRGKEGKEIDEHLRRSEKTIKNIS